MTPLAPGSHPRSTPPPLSLIPVDGWRLRALCRRHPALPPSTWDDVVINSAGRRELAPQREARIQQAKAVCRTCPVIEPCLLDVDLAYDEGVRGGKDLRDIRAALRRRTA